MLGGKKYSLQIVVSDYERKEDTDFVFILTDSCRAALRPALRTQPGGDPYEVGKS